MSGKDRNNPCKCGSNKKYKKCCLDKEYHIESILRNNIVNFLLYEDVFDGEANREEFDFLLKQLPLSLWLDNCVKVEFELLGSRVNNFETQKKILEGFFKSNEIETIQKKYQDRVIFSFVVLNFIRMTALKACDNTKSETCTYSSEILAKVFLMANNLHAVIDRELVTEHDEVVFERFCFRSLPKQNKDETFNKFMRTFLMFIDKRFETTERIKVLEIFKENTGFELSDYFALCFYVYNWRFGYTNSNVDVSKFNTYSSLIDKDTYLAKVKKSKIKVNEIFERISIHYGDLISNFKNVIEDENLVGYEAYNNSFSSYVPMLNVYDSKYVFLSLSDYVDSITHYVLYNITHNIKAEENRENLSKQQTGLYGKIFENYINKLIETTKKCSFVTNPLKINSAEELSDSVMFDNEDTVFFEIKSRRPNNKFSTTGNWDFDQISWEDLFLDPIQKALSKIDSSPMEYKSNNYHFVVVHASDIVSTDYLHKTVLTKLNKIYPEFNKKFKSLNFLHARDVEVVNAYFSEYSFLDLIKEKNISFNKDYCFRTFLYYKMKAKSKNEIELINQGIKKERAKFWDFAKNRFEIDK